MKNAGNKFLILHISICYNYFFNKWPNYLAFVRVLRRQRDNSCVNVFPRKIKTKTKKSYTEFVLASCNVDAGVIDQLEIAKVPS